MDPTPTPSLTRAAAVYHYRLASGAHRRPQGHGPRWAFGPQRRTFPDLVPPPAAAEGVARLEEVHRLLRADLEALSDDALDEPRWTNWGEQWPAWRIL